MDDQKLSADAPQARPEDRPDGEFGLDIDYWALLVEARIIQPAWPAHRS